MTLQSKINQSIINNLEEISKISHYQTIRLEKKAKGYKKSLSVSLEIIKHYIENIEELL